jgi:mannan endo-1,4-beta-mannosidase
VAEGGAVRAFALLFLCGCEAATHSSAMNLPDLSTVAPDLSTVAPDLSTAPDLAGVDLAGSDLAPPLLFVTAHGADLFTGAQRFRFVGANRYDVNSFPPGSGKYYCGNAYSDDDLDRSLMELASSTGATVLRVWAFQSFTLGGTDFSMLDRAVATARRHGLRLIFTLENEWKDCTQPDPGSADGRKSGAWFGGGYQAPLGTDPLAYRDYAALVVARYKDEPAIAMWQLMNEAESTDANALYSFVVDMAGLIKSTDANHLLSLGTLGGGQAGTSGANYKKLHSVAGVDVVEAHDYGSETTAMPGSPSSTSNSIFSDVADAASLGKPFFIGEAGIAAPSPMYSFSYAERAMDLDAKIAAHWSAGSDGFLVWSWYDLKTDNLQGWDFDGNDPLAAVLARHAAETP